MPGASQNVSGPLVSGGVRQLLRLNAIVPLAVVDSWPYAPRGRRVSANTFSSILPLFQGDMASKIRFPPPAGGNALAQFSFQFNSRHDTVLKNNGTDFDQVENPAPGEQKSRPAPLPATIRASRSRAEKRNPRLPIGNQFWRVKAAVDGRWMPGPSTVVGDRRPRRAPSTVDRVADCGLAARSNARRRSSPDLPHSGEAQLSSPALNCGKDTPFSSPRRRLPPDRRRFAQLALRRYV